MSGILDESWQQHIASSVAHFSEMAKAAIDSAAAQYERPSAVFKPRLSVEGNQWCALYGDNLQDGVAGFGDSPADAMWDFDRAWGAKLPAQQTRSNSDLVQMLSEVRDAERERWQSRVEEAFREGFYAPRTYNDTVLNTAGEAWEEAKAMLLKA